MSNKRIKPIDVRMARNKMVDRCVYIDNQILDLVKLKAETIEGYKRLKAQYLLQTEPPAEDS